MSSVDLPQDEEIVLSWQLRWWHALVSLFRPQRRGLTAEESRLRNEVSQLRSELARSQLQLKITQEQLERSQSEARVCGEEIKLMAMVIERDRARVEAETATYALKAALGSHEPRRRDEPS